MRVRFDAEAGGRLSSVEVHGWELLSRDKVDLFHWGNFVIAPWVGRLRHGVLRFEGAEHRFPINAAPHAVHGLVTQRPWRAERPGVLTIDFGAPWPWRGRLTHEVTLYPDRLEHRLTLEAHEPMPAAMGWHPWFPRTITGPDGATAGPIEIDVEPGLMYAHDDEGIPSGTLVSPPPRPWDYCFRDLSAAPRVRWPGALEIEIESDCSHWVIYDRDPGAVCVEPWTGPPNSLNIPSPRVVLPGEPLTAEIDVVLASARLTRTPVASHAAGGPVSARA